MQFRRILLPVIMAALALSPLFSEQRNGSRHILYLNSYNHRMSWARQIFEGIESVIPPGQEDLILHYEALDAKEFHSPDYFEQYRAYLEHKYRGYDFSLILSSDNQAFEFLLKNHKGLYPGVPVVFFGVNGLQSGRLQGHDEFTGIMEISSTANTVELMLRLHPESDTIYVINDYLESGRSYQRQMQADLAGFSDKIEFTYSENLSLEDQKRVISSLSDDTLILGGLYYADKDGLSTGYEQMTRELASAAELPFYTLVSSGIQEGVIGGAVMSGYVYGESAARLGMRILQGESAADIPLAREEYNKFTFNYPELIRYGIPLEQIPEGSLILNRPPRIYKEYRKEILFFLLLLLALSFTIIALVLKGLERKASEKTLQDFSDATWEGIVIHDRGIALRINTMFSTIFGYEPDELIGKDLIDKIVAPEYREIMRRKVATRDKRPYEAVGCHKSGRLLPIQIHVREMDYKGKQVRVAAIRDLSDEKKAQKEHAYLQTLWESTFEDSVEAIFIHDHKRIIERVNKSLLRITGYSREDVLGKHITLFRSEYHTDEVDDEMIASLKETGQWSGELLQRKKSGELYTVSMRVFYVNEHLPSERKTIAVFHDISAIKKQEEELKWMAKYDTLTGFANRTLFLDIMGRELKSSERKNEICAVMLLNLDGLKNINNSFGFRTGDEIIKEFSKRLKSALREGDFVSRFGGDEFAVLAPRFQDKSQIDIVIRRIQERVLKPVIIEDNSIDLSVSTGVALYPADGRNKQELIAKAGSALERTKTHRKGSYSLFNADQDKAVMLRSELEIHLQKALINEELDVFYQPKVDPVRNRVVGFEALIRWQRNHEEWVPPGVFIPISEANGFIIDIGYFVLNRACDFILKLRDTGYAGLHVGVNISAKQFSDDAFIDRLIRIVESRGILPSELDLEVTESITASKVYNVIESLTRLSDYGFSISIDDFGTGYSSLQYLMTLPFDTIKIDKSFVDTIEEGEGKQTVLNTLISLAHSLKKTIVAEGAESREQVNYLRDRDCELIQGYYFSKPLPDKEILEYIRFNQMG